MIPARSPLGSLRVKYLRSLTCERATQKGLVSSPGWLGLPRLRPGEIRLSGPSAFETGGTPVSTPLPGVTRGSPASSAGSG